MKPQHKLLTIIGSCGGLLFGMTGQASADQAFQYGGRSYVLVTTERSWEAARQNCYTRSMHLVTVDSEAENTYLADVLSTNSIGHAWIGLYQSWSGGAFQWVAGSSVGYTNWGSGEPNNTDGNEDFVELRPGGTWNDLPATWSIPAICESW
jgi:hypothetical protein